MTAPANCEVVVSRTSYISIYETKSYDDVCQKGHEKSMSVPKMQSAIIEYAFEKHSCECWTKTAVIHKESS